MLFCFFFLSYRGGGVSHMNLDISYYIRPPKVLSGLKILQYVRDFGFYLFTDCKFDISCTCFTLDVATPMKFAFTSFFYFRLKCVITPSAAHHLTTIRALRIQLTDSALCSLIDETRKLISVLVSYNDFYLP